MACQTGHDAKVEVGMRGAIQAIMTHISRKLERQVCDETVEVAWSFLWNITDETPLNCSMFLKKDGITLFWRCYKEWSVRKDLVRNMLGLIGNIAEVEHLRNYLMDDNLIKIFLWV
jgi:Zyg-11 family protein